MKKFNLLKFERKDLILVYFDKVHIYKNNIINKNPLTIFYFKLKLINFNTNKNIS